ncbi:uncharacterized protein LOC128958394 [Oppia nitens]|uniref:uncharacterized protein LOC128958394 n=1 Tax=Oppia nitens TaxID=1686743 RepID=UPI0023DBC151|nr:uncharacterized protein LOC128958394 [Oppia nitens]
MLNDTLILNPITIPYVVMPEAQAAAVPLNYPSFLPNYYSYDTYYGTANASPYFATHQAIKRSLDAAAAQHRYDLFNSIGDTLERYGIDGRNCIYRAICELATTPLLIESSLHEILEHILDVSRSYDEEGLLEEHLMAQQYGKEGKDCAQKYSSCGFSIFK